MSTATTATQTATFRVPAENMGVFAEKFTALTKAAVRYDVTPPSYQIIDRETKVETVRGFGKITREFIHIAAQFELITDGSGATFVAKIVDGEVTAHPDAPEGTVRKYWGIVDRCDACGVKRDRNTLHVLSDDRVVGTTCVKAVYGISPLLVLGWTEFVVTDFGSDLDASEGGSWAAPRIHVEAVLNVAGAAIRAFGWMSKGRAGEQDTPTSQYVSDFFFARGEAGARVRDAIIVTEEDEATTAATIAWLAAEDTASASDYIYKSARLVESAMIEPKNMALVVSLIAAYQRSVAKAVEAKAAEAIKAEAAPVPVTDKRMEVTGTIVSLQWRDNGYGTVRKAVILADEGYKLWGSIPSAHEHDVKDGDRVEFMARVEPSDDDAKFGFFTRPTKFVKR